MIPKNSGSPLVILVALLSLVVPESRAQSPDVAKITGEISKQEAIYRAEATEGYTVNRGLWEYTRALTPGFDRALATLGPDDRWLDIGAGEAQAILDYHTPEYDLFHPLGRLQHGRKARAVALSIEDRRTPVWRYTARRLGEGQIQYLSSRRLREYTLEELGRFRIITDVGGGFSYTERLSLFMEKVLGLLELNGSFYTLLQDVHSESGANEPHYPGSPYLTEIGNADGSEVKVCSWLKSITCVNVTCELKPRWQPPIEAFHVQKVCSDVTVPPLVTTRYAAGTPPERGFRLGK